jgi:glutathione peroxidase
VTTIDGKIKTLAEYKGQVLLIVNVASQCGFTGQYEGLEHLYKKYMNQSFNILGFPCNQFGGQEPGSDEEVKSFCELRFGVSFSMFTKIEVNGANTHPLFAYLKTQQKGILGSERIKWNFTKFLVNRHGKVVKRYGPQVSPAAIEKDILEIL